MIGRGRHRARHFCPLQRQHMGFGKVPDKGCKSSRRKRRPLARRLFASTVLQFPKLLKLCRVNKEVVMVTVIPRWPANRSGGSRGGWRTGVESNHRRRKPTRLQRRP